MEVAANLYQAGAAETSAGPQPYFAMELVTGRPLTAYADDNDLGPLKVASGDVWAARVEGDELVVIGDESTRFPATHSARNEGPNRYREILIETK